ncbi:MAG: uridylate kinase [Betaproteobacteria bacterium]|nr:uridylate kinase [Betaproteobacteria bacterium]
MWVLKLGGSLLGSPELPRWLDQLVKVSDGKVVIVPGGGLFANTVRDAQRLTQVSDACAHELALIAMDQFGLLMQGMNQGLVTASSELEIAERSWQHRAIIWLPSKMVLADGHISRNWQITSDSISAWLARKLSAEYLVLVKSAPLATYRELSPVDGRILSQHGLLDPCFPGYINEDGFHTYLLNKHDYDVFAHGLTLPSMYEKGIQIV